MKKFITILLGYIGFSIILLYCLDFFYTYTYYNQINPRNKISWIKNLSNQEKFDYALFGSSRCQHHINPILIKKKTGLLGINLGYAACNPLEIKLTVKEFIKTQDVKKIFIQIDNLYNKSEPSDLAKVPWLPYITETDIFIEFSNYLSKPKALRYLPFYRYMKYDTKIGFRDILLSYFGKESRFIKNNGFVPLSGKLEDSIVYKYNLKDIENKHIKEIIGLCHTKGISVEFFTAPIYKCNTNNDILNKYLKNYTDFSNSIADIKLFKDHLHLNKNGAELFTNIFIKKFLNSLDN